MHLFNKGYLTTGKLFIALWSLVTFCAHIFKAFAIIPHTPLHCVFYSRIINSAFYTAHLLVTAIYYLQEVPITMDVTPCN